MSDAILRLIRVGGEEEDRRFMATEGEKDKNGRMPRRSPLLQKQSQSDDPLQGRIKGSLLKDFVVVIRDRSLPKGEGDDVKRVSLEYHSVVMCL